MEHFKTVCSKCGILMGQCRCPRQDKFTKYEICQSCAKKIAEGKISEEKGTIGVGYNHGHSVSCPECRTLIEVRDKRNARIKDHIQCRLCGYKYKIVVPEDPGRTMRDSDLERLGSEGLGVLRVEYFAQHPETIKS